MQHFVVYQLNRVFDAKTQCVTFIEINSSCINFLVVIQLSSFVKYVIQFVNRSTFRGMFRF